MSKLFSKLNSIDVNNDLLHGFEDSCYLGAASMVESDDCHACFAIMMNSSSEDDYGINISRYKELFRPGADVPRHLYLGRENWFGNDKEARMLSLLLMDEIFAERRAEVKPDWYIPLTQFARDLNVPYPRLYGQFKRGMAVLKKIAQQRGISEPIKGGDGFRSKQIFISNEMAALYKSILWRKSKVGMVYSYKLNRESRS